MEIMTNRKMVHAESSLELMNPAENSPTSIQQTDIIQLSIFLILGILLFLFVLKILTSKKAQDESLLSNSQELTDKDLEKMDKNLNVEKLKEETFSLYKKLETAKTKQNVKNLKDILTDDLALEQEQKIKFLKENHQKVVATNIQLESFKVLSAEKIEDTTHILTYLHVSQYDYVMDKKKTVIRGTNESVYQIEYKIMLEQTPDKQFKIKKKECIGKWIKN